MTINSNNRQVWKIFRLNWLLVFQIIAICLVGFAMLYSAAGGNVKPWLYRQLMYFLLFFPAMIIIALIDVKFWYKFSYLAYLGAIILLIAVEVIGHKSMGATRWFRIGPINVQPSEIAKVCLVFALARYLHKVGIEDIKNPKYLIIPLILTAIPLLLILRQPDLGTSLILLAVAVVILFAAGVMIWKFIAVGAFAIISTPFAWFFLLHNYQKQRILTFLNPESDPLGSGYNIIQSKIAIGSGGMLGNGYLNGTQGQLDFLPEQQTDFIFTMLAEELGFLGALLTIFLLASIIITTIYIAIAVKNQFSRLLTIGVGTIFFLHIFINIGMVMGLLPVVGAPLPFVSYGGTMMATMLIGFGLVLNAHLHHDQIIKYDE